MRIFSSLFYTNTIRLDIYAGVQGKDTILFTAAHELTHFIKEWSEEKFNVFADFLVENYAKHGVDVDDLVQRKIENSKVSKTYEETLTYDEAFEEVICDSCESFLRDSDLMNKLVDLAKADLTLFEKCKLFIEELLADLQKAYKGLTPDSYEARIVLSMKDCIADLRAKWEDAALSARENFQAAGGKKNANTFVKEKAQQRGVAEDGKKIYESNFPKGTPKSAKSQRILDYIQNVWAQKPIKLEISNGETSRIIEAKFDPTVDETKNTYTDATKIAGGNRHGSSLEQRVTLDLADDYYQIVADSKYNYSRYEIGKTKKTHEDVKMWHYFVNDIYFAEYGESNYEPYTVTINIKEKTNGDFVYSFNAEKEPSIQLALHAAVNTVKGANGELFRDDSIRQDDQKSQEKNSDRAAYSYEELISKPDMKVTSIDDTVHFAANKENRKQVVEAAVKNAAAVGHKDRQGNAFVHVTDIDTDVMLAKNAFRHGFDRRFSFMAPFALEAGKILQNAIKVNELNVRTPSIANTYVLIGMAKDTNKVPYPVVFVVNKFSNEVESVDVLYSLGTKKEPADLNGPGFSPKIGVPLTGSIISISDLLEYVNAYFPDVLSEDVLRHYGYEERPKGKLGESALYQDRAAYSYEELISKPDMKVTVVGGDIPKNRADVVNEAKKNAAGIGKRNEDGSVSVYVGDIGADVILGTNGLKHGLDRRFGENAAVTLQAGFILQNSIKINELTPQKAEADKSYVLIGAAIDEDGMFYIVRSVVNRFSNALEAMEVLYAINAKKENRLRSMRPEFQRSVTDSTISISDLLEYVNAYFPDVLSEDVLRHYGHEERPKGKLGESALYQDRDTYSYDSLISKPDMKVTVVGGDIPKNRADVVNEAKKNAVKTGKFDPKTASVSVRVEDIASDVVISTSGLRHSLDRRFDINAPVALKAGEILENSIRINELNSQNPNADGSYVLIGAAQNERGELYIVRSVINRFQSELVSMDVLYAINAKTEPNLGTKKNRAGAYPQGFAEQSAILTDSTISISDLLEYVNAYFPDVLSEDVLRHYGHEERPKGKLGESALYQDRDISVFDYDSVDPSAYYQNSAIYSYDFLTSQKDMVAVELPKRAVFTNQNGKIDDAQVVAEGKKNARSVGTERGGKIYVKNSYTNRELRIDNQTIKHGLDGTYKRHLTNARIGMVIGDILKNAIPINGLNNASNAVDGTYAMAAYCNDRQGREFVAVVTVEQYSGDVTGIDVYDVAHAVSGRQKKSSQVDTRSQGVYPIKAATISISDFLEIVNRTHQSLLSEDVLTHLGEKRDPNGHYSSRVLFQDRDVYTAEYLSPRNLLADALETTIDTSTQAGQNELRKLTEYKAKIQRLEELSAELAEVKTEIRTISFTEGTDRSGLVELNARKTVLKDQINRMDKKLLQLEATKPLRDVLARERSRFLQNWIYNHKFTVKNRLQACRRFLIRIQFCG